MGHLAGIAQLVEHDLAKVGVEGPSPFSRSKTKEPLLGGSFCFMYAWIGTGSREEGPILFVPCTKCVGANNRSGLLGSHEPAGSKTSLAKQGDWDLTVPFPALKKTLQSVFFYAKNSPGGIISEKGSHLREKTAILRHFSRKKLVCYQRRRPNRRTRHPKFTQTAEIRPHLGREPGNFSTIPPRRHQFFAPRH